MEKPRPVIRPSPKDYRDLRKTASILPQMKEQVNLSGEWAYRSADECVSGRGTVPGCVHTDLLDEGGIGDPFYRDNEARQQWIGEQSWIYEKHFELDGESPAGGPLFLVCEGLDTLARVELNGHVLGETDNMFRIWRFDAAQAARIGENVLCITFSETFGRIREMAAEKELVSSGDGTFRRWGGHYIRKNQSNYGWDWGPICVTAGIWGSIYLEMPGAARIADVALRQPTVTPERAVVEAELRTECFDSETALRVNGRLCLNGVEVSDAAINLDAASGTLGFEVAEPQLWWPNGLGEQPLYEVELELKTAEGTLLDTWQHRVGLRQLRLVREPDEAGESFYFEVNGRAVFARGSNWIPADVFPSRLTAGDYRRLLTSAAAAHHNMVRVWGGGIYEAPAFYEACDELGLLVWQDFMYACAAYPLHDAGWRANALAEAEEAVRRLRNHSCLALWCGNNELEMMAKRMILGEDDRSGMGETAYREFFHEALPSVVATLDPERAYWPSSSHNPRGEGWASGESAGDVHYWGVWWGLRPFESYREITPRFCSEFGFQSFPHPRTLEGCTRPEDRNLVSRVMDRHQKANTRAGDGNATILSYLGNQFRIPDGFENQVMLSQIVQAQAIAMGVEHWRRSQPHCMGALYWQLNDCWPGQSWSSIDYDGRWKALHYASARFFHPILISGRIDAGTREAMISLTNETAESAALLWSATVTDPAGRIRAEFDGRTQVEPGAVAEAARLPLRDYFDETGGCDALIWLRVARESHPERAVNENLLAVDPPKYWGIEAPEVIVTSLETAAFETLPTAVAAPLARGAGPVHRCRISVEGAAAYWLHPDPATDWTASEAFFHLRPGESRELWLRAGSAASGVASGAPVPDFRSLWDLTPVG